MYFVILSCDGSAKNFPLRYTSVLFYHTCSLKVACVHLRGPKSISASASPNLALLATCTIQTLSPNQLPFFFMNSQSISLLPVILTQLIHVHLSKQNMNSLRTTAQFENSGTFRTNHSKDRTGDTSSRGPRGALPSPACMQPHH